MTAPQLVLEIKEQADTTLRLGNDSGVSIMVTPSVSPEYFVFRVRLSDDQAILGFEKFGTVGIGFASEEDWNTNLPYTCAAEQIFGHIKHNKGDAAIDDETVLEAIAMVQAAAHRFKGTSPDPTFEREAQKILEED